MLPRRNDLTPGSLMRGFQFGICVALAAREAGMPDNFDVWDLVAQIADGDFTAVPPFDGLLELPDELRQDAIDVTNEVVREHRGLATQLIAERIKLLGALSAITAELRRRMESEEEL